MKKLPIGVQTFSDIIHEDYLYVDKTREIYNVLSSGKYFFLSRPRRFGKSLLISTLHEIFAGNQELFKGLYIYDKIDWQSRPVIHLDFLLIPHDTEDRLLYGLRETIKTIVEAHQLHLEMQEYDLAFQQLIMKLAEKYQQKVVVLVDEYDKPLIDAIEKPDIAQANRDILRNFYGVLKGCDPYLRLVFLTGVSKFSRVSIFSGLNNLDDITLEPQFATITGITQEELESYFADYLTLLQQSKKLSKDDFLDRIRFWYNGYSWDGSTLVYNPFSLLNFFKKQQFQNYWFATGTPTFLIQAMRAQKFDVTTLEQKTLTLETLESYDIHTLHLTSLLFQTGYITIKAVKEVRHGALRYILSYPNFEVEESLLRYLLADFAGNPDANTIPPLYDRMLDHLEAGQIEEFLTVMRSVFASIPYPLHLPEEAYYHSLFYIILKLLGADINAEVMTDKGRVDGVLEFDDRIYIIECKYGQPGTTSETLTNQAIQQIHAKKYYEPFLDSGKKLLLMGIGFLEKQLAYQLEELKSTSSR